MAETYTKFTSLQCGLDQDPVDNDKLANGYCYNYLFRSQFAGASSGCKTTSGIFHKSGQQLVKLPVAY